MKLIDLLVQELPKRGGWPQNALSITQDNDGSLCVWDTNNPHYEGFSWKHHTGNSLVHYWYREEWATPLSSDHKESIVTYWQYKAALAASQKPAWNGEGVPTVGCECESKQFSQVDWNKFKVVAVCDGHVFGFWGNGASTALDSKMWEFRPLRTEAESKRDAAIEAMQREADDGDNWIYSEYEIIYDAIAAGKIPGVKLDG